MPDTTIVAGPLELQIYNYGVFSKSPPAQRDQLLDTEVDLENNELVLRLDLQGQLLNISISADPLELYLSLSASTVDNVTVSASPLELRISLNHHYAVVTTPKTNVVKWSKIGQLDFTIGLDNVAGERPMEWSGTVYDILKLSNSVIVYGENGISMLTPSGSAWGMVTINRLGIANKGAVCGTEFTHFFVDKLRRLNKFSSEGMKLLDYSEYLKELSSIKMFIDNKNDLVYICDGSIGFVYSILGESFGEGLGSISGIGYKDGQLFVTSPSEIDMPKIMITSDIYDLGSRSPKTIQSIEIGTDLTEHLEVMIESRNSNKGQFIQSRWALVNPSGIAYIPCYGIEFRINLRSYIYEEFEIDYIKLNGMVHEYNYLNSLGIQ